jgi:hypothetical protein
MFNPYGRVKSSDYKGAITLLMNHNFTLNEIKVLFINFCNPKRTVRYNPDVILYCELYRKVIITNNEEQVVHSFIIDNWSILFSNKIIVEENYILFKDLFIYKMQKDITKYNSLNMSLRFKYFEDFLDKYYANNNLKENNKLLSNIFYLTPNCNHPNYYIDSMNKKNINYNLDGILLIDNMIVNNKINLFFENSALLIVEDLFEKVHFYEVSKLILTKCIKKFKFNLLTIMLLIKSVKSYKIVPPDLSAIFELIKECQNNGYYYHYLDKYLDEYFTICFNKKYYQSTYELLNKCAEMQLYYPFKSLINLYKIKPTNDTLNIIIKNINPSDTRLLQLLFDSKFLLNPEHINCVITSGKFRNNLKKVLIENNYVILDDTIFENYIRYENYLEDNALNDFILNSANQDKYFEVIHNNNKYKDYNMFKDFIITKLGKSQKELKHYLEFTKKKYKTGNYKNEIEEYIKNTQYPINKYCVDMSFKNGNYDCGNYLLEKYNIKADINTLIFIKDLNTRIDFYKKLKNLDNDNN